MTEPWRLRCPEGHADLSMNNDYYRCDTCGLTYEGEPFDAAETDFPADGETRTEWTPERAVARLWEVGGDIDAARMARQLGDESLQIGNALAKAAEQGLVEWVNNNYPRRWSLTQKGYIRVCGEDPDTDAPEPEEVDPSKYLVEEGSLEFDKRRLYRLHWGYGLSVPHIRELCGFDGKNTLRNKLREFGIPTRSWHDHTGWEPHHGIPPMYEWPRGEDPNVDEDDSEWVDYKPAMDAKPEVPSDD